MGSLLKAFRKTARQGKKTVKREPSVPPAMPPRHYPPAVARNLLSLPAIQSPAYHRAQLRFGLARQTMPAVAQEPLIGRVYARMAVSKAGGARALIGHFVPMMVIGALSEALPERAIAAVGSPLWCINLSGVRPSGSPFTNLFFMNGGYGGSHKRDGANVLSWPSNISSTPVEIIACADPLWQGRQQQSGAGDRHLRRAGRHTLRPGRVRLGVGGQDDPAPVAHAAGPSPRLRGASLKQ